MIITVNGRDLRLAAPATVAELVSAQLGRQSGAGIAVALNGTVVPRHRHDTQQLTDGDRVDIVTAVPGG